MTEPDDNQIGAVPDDAAQIESSSDDDVDSATDRSSSDDDGWPSDNTENQGNPNIVYDERTGMTLWRHPVTGFYYAYDPATGQSAMNPYPYVPGFGADQH
jgi:hypothetical protein